MASCIWISGSVSFACVFYLLLSSSSSSSFLVIVQFIHQSVKMVEIHQCSSGPVDYDGSDERSRVM